MPAALRGLTGRTRILVIGVAALLVADVPAPFRRRARR
jgi:hypothetical protein